MERVFSLEEEIPQQLFAPPPPPLLQPQLVARGVEGAGGVGVSGIGSGGEMNWGPPKWCFQKFMEDALLDVPDPPPEAKPNASALCPKPTAEASGTRRYDRDDEVVEVISAPPPAPAVADPVTYNAALKRKLEADLAAVTMWRASGAMRQQNSQGNRSSQNSNNSNLGSQNHIGGNGILVQQKSGGGPSGWTGPNLVKNADVGVKQVSSSSREPSPSDEDVEGEAETMGNMNFTAEKVKKRKESNRDSARRSRSRKAAHLKDLEEQVSQLRVENSSLMRRLAEVSQKYNNAVVDSRVLTAKVETLQTKVKMAEETMKRVTGTSNLSQAISSISSLSIPFSGFPSDGASDASVPIQDTPLSYFTAAATNAGVNDRYIPEAAPAFQIQDPAASLQMQPMASLEQLQRRVCRSGLSSSAPAPQWGAAMLDPNELVNMGML